MAKAFGDQPARVVQAAKDRPLLLESQAAAITAHAAVTYTKDRNFEREAVVDERALLADALRRSMGEVTVRAIHAEFEQRVAAGEFIGGLSPQALRVESSPRPR